MAKHAKALHHHGKAGDCLAKGDHKGAAHHLGHALASLRGASDDGEVAPSEFPIATDGDVEEQTPEQAPKSSIRDRLKGLRGA